MKDTSWEKVSDKYNKLLNVKGDYYHENLVIPKSLKLLDIRSNSKVLDLGCGQGIFSRYIPKETEYLGLDASKSLVASAEQLNKNPKHQFNVQDLTQEIKNARPVFSHAVVVLALQNMAKPEILLLNASRMIETNGKLLLVLNHPHFRIPRHSAWENDDKNNTTYRKVNRYLSRLEIPINHAPGDKNAPQYSVSYHYSLDYISSILFRSGFVIEKIEEWASEKKSVGRHAKRENISRAEIPLFMAILCKKLS